MSNRIKTTALSSLTLIIAGAAGTAGAAALPAPAEQGLESATSINADLDALRMSEFVELQAIALAGGHHSDSIGSHHHHDAVPEEQAQGLSNARFDV
ncbi:hypothetical protein [Stenotrophomonas maltophilia]|uniref:hypothetical protein n=1 Tax=Stenotrophomonas maltophilia TaxID=40324 RepID=UPI000C262647|nr:hypothetical protein [Stenotrophomonas maltophilia]PJL59234.1 hypothetical protein B9Y82_11075 [Stenotrophomonas maltophilia]